MAAYQVLLLNTAIPQIQAAQSGDTYVVPRDIAFSAKALIGYTDYSGVGTNGLAVAGNVGVGTSSPNSKIDAYYATTPIGPTTWGTAATLRSGTGTFSLTGANNRGIGTLVHTNQNSNTTLPYGGNYEVFGLLSAANAAANGGYGVYGVAAYSRSDGAAYAIRADAVNTAGTSGTYAYGLYVGSVTGAANNYGIYVNDTSANNYIGGNLGLGVTPSASWTDFTVFQNIQAAILGYPGQTHYTQNVYYQSNTWKYLTSSIHATRYSQLSGIHAWHVSTSAQTAGTDVVFSQKMTLDADGTFRVKGAGTAGSTDAVQFSGSAPAQSLILDSNGKLSVDVGGTTGTTYNIIGLNGGGAIANGAITTQSTTNVANTATTILTVTNTGNMVMVTGQGSGAIFMDLLLCGYTSNTVTVITSATQQGSPAARTYTLSSGALQLQMGSATAMTVKAVNIFAGA